MPGRKYSSTAYKYGYNKGSEKDDEIAGEGNTITTFYREGMTRLLVWESPDPKASEQPWQSPYSYMDGNPIWHNDPMGDVTNEDEYPLLAQKKTPTFEGFVKHAILTSPPWWMVEFFNGISLIHGSEHVKDKQIQAQMRNEGGQYLLSSSINIAIPLGIRAVGLNKFINSLANSKITQNSVKSKLANYLLNPDHPVGASKAKWFEKALGFTKDNMDDLAKQIKFDPKTAIFKKNNGYADLYEQMISVTGANGKTIKTQFNFAITNGESAPKLVGAIPAKK